MHNNQNKTVSANSKGIVICFRDVNKHRFIPYESQYVKQIQLYGTSKYQHIEAVVFNSTQRRIYDEALYGFAIYSTEEVRCFTPTKKHFIQKNYHRVQRFLARWKEDIMNQRIDNFLLKLFHRSDVIKEFVKVTSSEYQFSNPGLQLSDDVIARKLVEFKLLPSNFFNLT